MVAKSIFLLLASAAAACSAGRSDPSLPKTSGKHELPPPAGTLRFKSIALGFGIQNYTCKSAGVTAASVGAVAMFYDVSQFAPNVSAVSLSLERFYGLPAVAVEHHAVPLRFNNSAAGRVDPRYPGVTQTWPFMPGNPLRLPGMNHDVPFTGHHFFNTNGEPEFVLDDGAVDLIGAKVASTSPPSNADKGPDGAGAVAWLALSAKPGSRGAKFIYRVETAGGNPHGCSKAGEDSSHYAALYYVYE